jgi:hypothetical protein
MANGMQGQLMHQHSEQSDPTPPVYDPYRAAREAYLERQQQAALNAQRVNEQLGKYLPTW